MKTDMTYVTFHHACFAKRSRDAGIIYLVEKFLLPPPRPPGDRRSVVTLSPSVDKDLFHINSNPETMTYQSLKSLEIRHPWAISIYHAANDNGRSFSFRI